MASSFARAFRSRFAPRSAGAARFFWFFLIGNVMLTALVSLLLYAKAPSELEAQTIDLHRTMLLQASRSLDTALLQTDLFLQQLSVDATLVDIPEYKKRKDVVALLAVNEKLNNLRVINRHVLSLELYYPEERVVFLPNAGCLDFREAPGLVSIDVAAVASIQPGWIAARNVFDLRTGRERSVVSVVKYLSATASGNRPFAVANIDEEYLRFLSGSLTGVEAAELLLVDEKGAVFASLNERGYWKKLVGGPGIQNLLGRSAASEIIEAGDRYLVTVAASELKDWSYVSLVPLPAISKKIRFLRTYSIAVVLFGLLSSFAFSFFFSRRLNVFVFRLLKLVNPEKTEKLRNPLSSLENTLRELREHSRALETNLREQLPILRNHALEGLIRGQLVGADSPAEVLSSYGLELSDEDEYFCLVVALQGDDEVDPSGRSRDLSAIIVLDLIREVLPDGLSCSAAFTQKDELVLVIGSPQGVESEEAIGCRVFDVIEGQIKPVVGIGILVGLGDTHRGLASVARSYREAKKAIRLLRFKAASGVAAFCDAKGADNSGPPYSVEDEDSLVQALRRGDAASALSFHEALMAAIAADESRRYALQLLSVTLRTCSDLGIQAPSSISSANPYVEVLGLEDSKAIDLYLRNLYAAILDNLRSRHARRNKIVAEKVAEYVRRNFHEPLSLTLLSREVCLSEAYLSRIFHEEMRQPLKQFINAVRVEEAKKLLSDSSLLISEVGRRVGYGNAHAFMKFFKEQTGFSPKEYRSIAD